MPRRPRAPPSTAGRAIRARACRRGAATAAAAAAAAAGGGGGFASQHKSINFEHECTLIARQLKNLDKLPAVIFCMSRKKCVEGAHAIKGLNLLVGGRPKPEPDKETDLEAWFAWSEVSQM